MLMFVVWILFSRKLVHYFCDFLHFNLRIIIPAFCIMGKLFQWFYCRTYAQVYIRTATREEFHSFAEYRPLTSFSLEARENFPFCLFAIVDNIAWLSLRLKGIIIVFSGMVDKKKKIIRLKLRVRSQGNSFNGGYACIHLLPSMIRPDNRRDKRRRIFAKKPNDYGTHCRDIVFVEESTETI